VATGDLTAGQRAFLDHLLGSRLADAFYLSGRLVPPWLRSTSTTAGAKISTSSPGRDSTRRPSSGW